MIAVAQRVLRAGVRVETAAGTWDKVGSVERGLLVLLGVSVSDGEDEAAWIARKLAQLRVFPDEGGRLNRAVLEVGGGILLVSQFTLLGDCRRGNRPSFIRAAPPEQAEPLVESVVKRLRGEHGVPVATGRFRTEMRVELINDGPVTIVIESPDRTSE